MPVAIIAGIPRDHVKRLKRAAGDRAVLVPDWRVEWFAAGYKVGVAPSQITDLLARAGAEGGAHVLVLGGHAYPEVKSRISPYFRVRRVAPEILKYLPHNTPAALDELAAALEEETKWAECVKPAAAASPILLPQTTFFAASHCRGLWKSVEDFGSPERIKAAATMVAEFKSYHSKRQQSGGWAWQATNGQAFIHNGARHGAAPFPREWKYSYRIPPGFHYDVTAVTGREFQVIDARGQAHRFGAGTHANVCAHGFVRGRTSD